MAAPGPAAVAGGAPPVAEGAAAGLRFVLRFARGGAEFAMDGAIPLDGVTAVIGPSGSGKTTLLRMLAGLEPGARGEILCGDEVWLQGRRRLAPDARRIGMVFQDGRLFDHLSVAENVAYGARRRGVDPAAVQGILDGMALGALAGRRPRTLSGGEQRRVAVARALASGPRLLFMDEPLAGLDDDAKARVLPYIARAVRGAGVPVIYVTHARGEVARFADRILRVAEGRIVGWAARPPALDALIEEVRGGQLVVSVDGVRFALAGTGRPGSGLPGDAVRVSVPPESAILSRRPPGETDALAVLPVEVAAISRRPAGFDLTLLAGGQPIDWWLRHDSALAADPPAPGDRLFLTLRAADLR